MIAIRFGRWSSSHGNWFTWERIYWKGWRWTPFVWVSWRYPKSKLAKYNAQALLGLQSVIDPIRDQDHRFLRGWVERLKTSDGEGWAVGEMLERACILLDALGASCTCSLGIPQAASQGYQGSPDEWGHEPAQEAPPL